jgi:hypothetical protein
MLTAEHRRTTERRRAGDTNAQYPPGSYAPSGEFTPWPDERPTKATVHLQGAARSRRGRRISRAAKPDLLVTGIGRKR